tara:strand:+ start:208 stop:486 length:279 start_codon:yes stop_codon:yes gene_type:complete
VITLIEAHPLSVINGRFLQEATQTFSLGLDSQRRLALVAEEVQVGLWRVPTPMVGNRLAFLEVEGKDLQAKRHRLASLEVEALAGVSVAEHR